MNVTSCRLLVCVPLSLCLAGCSDPVVAPATGDTASEVTPADTVTDTVTDTVADTVSSADAAMVTAADTDTMRAKQTDGGDSSSPPEVDTVTVTDTATAADTISDTAPDTAANKDITASKDITANKDTTVNKDTTANKDTAADTSADVPAAEVVVGQAQDGCSDGSREGFLDKAKFPLLAACQGAWTIKGVHHGMPACKREGGNDGKNAKGVGCNVEDLCAEGWHVCFGAKDVLERNAHGCNEIAAGAPAGPKFFLARTSSTGAFNCSQDSTKFGAPGTSNDLFGCGNLGCPLDLKKYPTCNPLNMASHDVCKGLRNDKNCGSWCSHLGKFAGEPNTWDCGKSTTLEANNVIKSDPTRQGGVLCCSDSLMLGP